MRALDCNGPSPGRWLLAAALDWLIIVATLTLALHFDSLAGYLAALFVVGNRQHALAILGHDGGHRLVTRTKWLNDLLTNVLCFWPLGVGIHAYRRFHFAHHRLTGSAADPELVLKGHARPLYDLPAPRGRLVRQFCKDLLGGGIPEIVDLVRHVRPLTVGDRLGPLFWWLAVGGTCLALGAWPVVLVWFAAMLTTYWAMFRLRIWTEHVGTDATHRVSLRWWQRWLFAPHNTWCHYEHHRWPGVSFARLPACRALDAEVPVLRLDELFAEYKAMQPIASGQALGRLPAPEKSRQISEYARVRPGRLSWQGAVAPQTRSAAP